MNEVMQWLGEVTGLEGWTVTVFIIVFFALLLDYFQRRLAKRLKRTVEATENVWDDAVFFAASRPISLFIWVIGVTLAAQFVPYTADAEVLAPDNVARIRQVGLLVSLAWFLLRLATAVENNFRRRAREKDEALDETTVQAVGRLARIAITVTVVLVIMDTLGFSVSGLLAAGGIGGIAIGLAAKDLLANFFGGLTVYMDRPFSVGDWIRSPDRSIEGVVENIGWRQTTIRTFDRRPLYVPNATFTTITVENPSRMTHRRIYETVGIRYDDVGVMTPIVDAVREMLVAHTDIDDRQTLMVHFNAFGPSSVDFFLYCFTYTTDWQTYHAIKQDVLLRVARIVEDHGAEIAYPTTTVHLKGEPPFAGLPGAEAQEKEA